MSRLIFVTCPRAILRKIAERIIEPFNGQIVPITGLLCPKKKRLKSAPLIAHTYTFPSVVFGFRVIASCVHVLPCCVKPRISLPVRSVYVANKCPGTFTSTRQTFSMSYVRTNYDFLSSARAFAQPKSRPTFCVACFGHNEPFSEAIAGHIYKFWIFCHDSLYRLNRNLMSCYG